MLQICVLLLALASTLIPAYALDVTGKILWNDVCSNIGDMRPSRVALDNGKMTAGIMRDGSFVITDVPAGTYVLSVIAHDHLFDQLRVDIIDSSITPEIRPYVAGTPLNPPAAALLSYPVVLTPRQKHVYFIPPESFNLIAMFSNPMMLLMVFGGGMMLAMPYIMKNIDPEALEDFKGQQAKMAGMQRAMANGDFKSGMSSLLAGGDEVPGNAALTSSNKIQSNVKSRTVKNKRR